MVHEVLQEALRLPESSADRARALGRLAIPHAFGALRARVNRDHHRLLAAVDEAIYTRFGRCDPVALAVLRTAAEQAVMEQCARTGLRTSDQAYLRRAWNTLRAEHDAPPAPGKTRQHPQA